MRRNGRSPPDVASNPCAVAHHRETNNMKSTRSSSATPRRRLRQKHKRRASHRLLWSLAILAGFGGCLSPDRPFCDAETPCANGQTCDVENHACLLGDDGEESPGGERRAAIVPPPGGLVDSVPDSAWTEGTFSVSNDGAAEYHLPLWVPDGRRGLQPELALRYNSRGGNGLVGVGWSLQGLSSISPCPRTLAHDGVKEPVSLLAIDEYCLGGNRLRPVNSNGWPGRSSREYRTERDSFARILSQTPPSQDPLGFQPQPDYFKAWTKDGRILTFGRTENARLRPYRLSGSQPEDPVLARGNRATATWSLNRVEDRNGNAIDIEYEHLETGTNMWGLEMVPKRITYGPNRSVQFLYESRPDPVDSFLAAFAGGVHMRLGKRLQAIQMFEGSELLREYRLTCCCEAGWMVA
jgi:Salmonella virulence plasmid 65kDa B protein